MVQRLFIFILTFCLAISAGATPPMAADLSQMQNASCRSPVPRNDQDIKNHFAKKLSGRKTLVRWGPFDFPEESVELAALFKRLTERDPYAENSNPSPLLLKAARQCQNINCALKILFGEPEYWKVLYLLDRYNINTSYLRYDEAARWTNEELNIILETFSFVPDFLARFPEEKKLVHYLRKKSDPRNVPNVAANSNIIVYDVWNSYPRSERIYILFHELAHNWNLSNKNDEDLDRNEEWLKITGWKMIPAVPDVLWEHDDHLHTYWVSDRARFDSHEDFAESVASFRFNSRILQEKDPRKFHFLKENVFRGYDFQSNQNCP